MVKCIQGVLQPPDSAKRSLRGTASEDAGPHGTVKRGPKQGTAPTFVHSLRAGSDFRAGEAVGARRHPVSHACNASPAVTTRKEQETPVGGKEDVLVPAWAPLSPLTENLHLTGPLENFQVTIRERDEP
jgi:hypothetical protein